MKRRLAFLILLVTTLSAKSEEPMNGDSTIRGKYGESEIVITTTNRLAGAIHSLTWNGKEFIDSADHGRQLQSASNLDCGKQFFPEVFNPTEAGSMRDGDGPKSTSRLEKIEARENQLFTRTRMAFWLAPGEKSSGHPAYNDRVCSDHLLEKRVTIGFEKMPNVISYDVKFILPPHEKHTYAQFEAVTGYMPPEFHRFWKFNRSSNKLEVLDDGPGEQSSPIVFSTESGSHAMGIFSPDQPSKGFEKAGYGRFRFKVEKVVKWNCVFRVRNANGIEAKEFIFRSFVVVGPLSEVERTLSELLKAK